MILCIWAVCIQYVCFQLYDGQPWLYNKASCSLIWLLGAGFPVASRLALWVLTAGGEKWAARSTLISIADNYKSQRKQAGGIGGLVILQPVCFREGRGTWQAFPKDTCLRSGYVKKHRSNSRGSGCDLHRFSYVWGNAFVRSDVGVSFGLFIGGYFTWKFNPWKNKVDFFFFFLQTRVCFFFLIFT